MIPDTLHKKSGAIQCLLLSFLILTSCGVRTADTTHRSGTAGQPVYFSVQADHLQVNQMVEWHFTNLPEGVILTQYDFDPSPRSQQVVFTPPDTGVYKITYTIKEMSGNPVLRKPFTLDVDRRAGSGQAADTARDAMAPAEGASTRSVTIDDREDEPEREITPEVLPESDSHETEDTNRDDALEKIPDRYTVQVAARKSFSDAESLASRLKQLGYKAYIQRVQFPDTGEIWYRVRIGSYSTAAAARALKVKLEDLSLLRNQDVWVDFQRKNR
ncbi:MAG: hypothetical protein GF372_09510 [Candidatus Marinimicrobia bacterium]|nr:hypothetical protein [Candidatus Neomarinimicrobiota bacterium]